MSTNPALALQTALRSTLIADAGLVAVLGGERVHDDVPQGSGFPYVTLGDIETTDWSTQTARGHEHKVTINVWSQHHGRKEVQTIIGEIDRILDGADPVLVNHRLVNLRVVFWTAQRSPDGETYRGLMRLRAVTEPLA